MSKMSQTITKAVIASIVGIALFLGMYSVIGYERTELIAFAVLIGLSVAALK
ncbi:hypothetical protein [Alicyclobacillus dauci]|uniref:Uncharacterized protein n=1 Tax=Alicyclobacillus dauci TaxID=1475485 RepID=A0ABY6Z1E5_9BACL|nr:hypothetical protein [Alicyclobacillus dauci]WAH36403.1 hypothetical protein NZD86_19615 [Alicyclobacillus dauci]